ncbi:MAG: DNA internalization-related competence protein ComEC/Rec2 [Clostridiales bacterium]|nr:DNA internalization-related competence protein ComEC/Rec2 [Clostridiales bacterium]
MRKFAYLAFPFAGGVFAAAYIMPESALLFSGIILAAGGIAFLFIKTAASPRLTRIMFGASCGIIWFFLYNYILYAPVTALDGARTEIRAEVISFSEKTEYGGAVRARLLSEGMPRVKMVVWLKDGELPLRPGDIMQMEAKLTLSSQQGSGIEDYYRGLGIYLFAGQSGGIDVIKAPNTPLRYAHVYIAHGVRSLLPKLFSGREEGVMAALMIGDRRQLNNDPALMYALQRSGLSHLISVSGTHVSFLVSLVSLTVLRRRRLANLLSIPAVLLFMAMTGFSPGVVRAGIMQLFIIAAAELQREPDPLTSLSAALVVLLAVNPFSSRSVSLQLSFAATLGLILFSGKFHSAIRNIAPVKRLMEYKGPLSKRIRSLLNFVIAGFSATLCAMVFTVPLGAVHFGSVSLAAPFSNLIAMWSVTVAFCAGIIAVALGMIWLPLGKIAAFAAGSASGYFTGVAERIGSFGLSAVETGSVYMVVWLLSAYAIFLVWFIMKGAFRRVYLPAGVCAALMCLCLLLSWTRSRDMTVAALDVGQGSCTVITDGRTAVVVDCGGDSRPDAGATAAAYLRGLGYESIDALIFTHLHDDHANGARILFEQFDVKCAILPNVRDEESLEVEKYAPKETPMIVAEDNLVIRAGELDIRVYKPVAGGSNEDGLGVVCSRGGFDAVITGDMGAVSEMLLVALNPLPDAEVLIVGHHGSEYSTSEEFLGVIKPEIAIISVGALNRYGHPSAGVLERLGAHSARVLRTDINGTVVIRSDQAYERARAE